MGFKISSSNQSESIGNTCQAFVFKHVHRASEKTAWMRLSGFPVGAVSGLLNVATRVSLIGEAALKGAINIVGSPFPNKCSLKTGLKQIAWHVPKNVVFLPFTMVGAIITLFHTTYSMAKDPKHHCLLAEKRHNLPAEMEAFRQEQAEGQRADEKRFNGLCAKLEESPDDIESMRAVAECYFDGKGVESNVDTAIEYYQKLCVEHKDQSAAVKLYRIYGLQGERNKSFEYAQKAAELGSVGMMLMLAGSYERNVNGKTIEDAIFWYTEAAEKDSEKAMFELGKIYLTDTHWDRDTATEWFRQAADKGHQPSVGYLTALQEREGVNSTARVFAMEFQARSTFEDAYELIQRHENPKKDISESPANDGDANNQREIARLEAMLSDNIENAFNAITTE